MRSQSHNDILSETNHVQFVQAHIILPSIYEKRWSSKGPRSTETQKKVPLLLEPWGSGPGGGGHGIADHTTRTLASSKIIQNAKRTLVHSAKLWSTLTQFPTSHSSLPGNLPNRLSITIPSCFGISKMADSGKRKAGQDAAGGAAFKKKKVR